MPTSATIPAAGKGNPTIGVATEAAVTLGRATHVSRLFISESSSSTTYTSPGVVQVVHGAVGVVLLSEDLHLLRILVVVSGWYNLIRRTKSTVLVLT